MSCRAKRRRKGKGNYFRIGGGGGEGMSDSRKEKLGKLAWRSNPSLSVAKRGTFFGGEHNNRMGKSEFVLIRYSESPRNQPSK